MRLCSRLALGLLLGGALAAPAEAGPFEMGRQRFDPGGKVKAARAFDVDGDGRRDVVLLVEPKEGKTMQVVLLRTPAEPDPKTFFRPEGVTRITCDGDLAAVGALALGRFGPAGAFRLRFLGPAGLVDVDAAGVREAPDERRATPTLFARSAGRPLALWEGAADLDGDGHDELWFPAAAEGGRMHLLGGKPAQDRVLSSAVGNVAATGLEDALRRTTYVPTLVATDLDGDGTKELVELKDGALHGYDACAAATEGVLAPSTRLPLAFLTPPADLPPEEVRTSRLVVADADGDGKADLLVTLVSGRRDKLGGLRTTLWFLPGPLTDPTTGAVRVPEGRVDTESVALHPRFVDLDGDGALDYLTDSIRGSTTDLVRNAMGAEPKITLVGFRFDKAARRYETQPSFTLVKPYATDQALTNKFGISAWFDGDFDGDGLNDLLDLGNLSGVEVLGAARRAPGGSGDALVFATPLLSRVAVPKPLVPGALLADLTGDGRAEAVLWTEEDLYVLSPRGAR